MNKSILYRSFKHLCTNYHAVTKLSMSTYEVLCQELYTDNKLKIILYNNYTDFDICEFIMRFVKDRTILNDYLISACLNNNTRLVQLLLPYIVDIYFNNNNAMYSACIANNLDIARMLIAYGSDIHFDNDSIITKHKYYSNNVFSFLFQEGIDPNKHRDYLLKNVLDLHDHKLNLLRMFLSFNLKIE